MLVFQRADLYKMKFLRCLAALTAVHALPQSGELMTGQYMLVLKEGIQSASVANLLRNCHVSAIM